MILHVFDIDVINVTTCFRDLQAWRTVNKHIMATEIEAWTTGPQNDGTNIKPLVVTY